MDKIERSCIDCAARACMIPDNAENYPAFCQTKNITKEIKDEVIAQYVNDEDNARIIKAVGEVELMGKMTRVQETIEFAKQIGAKKIGIATCISMLSESRTLAKILRNFGFEVYGVSCKCGAIRKKTVGLNPKCEKFGVMVCDPILQARRLDEEKVDLSITMGLCVGHDTLFYKHAKGLVTTLVTKDKITGNNPVAPLYTTDSFYSFLLKKPEE